MVRLTPKQLQEAKRAKQAERQAEAEAAEAHCEWLTEAKERFGQLTNVADGLYQELDKLAKKWPTMPVTERTVTRVNKLLGAIRGLLENEDDDFVDALEDLVPAGDLPETRDVVMTLREAKDALVRFEARYQAPWHRIEREQRENG